MDRAWRGLAAAATAVIIAAGAAGCGDDGGTDDGDAGSARAWARGICQIQLDYEGAIVAAVTEQQAALGAAADDLEGQKQAVLALLDAALAETDAAIDGVDQLGEPDADGGDTALEAATDRYATVRAILEGARTQAAALPTTDPAAFEAAVSQVADAIGAGFAEQSSSLPDVQTSEELREAFAAEPICNGG